LKNKGAESLVITSLKVIIHERGAMMGPLYQTEPMAIILEPLAVWNIGLPKDEGAFEYTPISPVFISSGKAAIISLRLYVGNNDEGFPPHEDSFYVLKIVFCSDAGLEAESAFFILWNKDVIAEQ
jgi:hypothetical protein